MYTLCTIVRATARRIMYIVAHCIYTLYTEVRATARPILNVSLLISDCLYLSTFISVLPFASVCCSLVSLKYIVYLFLWRIPYPWRMSLIFAVVFTADPSGSAIF